MISYSDIRRNMENAQAQERERVARKQAFEREMKGTFDQNAALQRELHGTWQQNADLDRKLQGTWADRNKAAFDLQRQNNDAAMDRARLGEDAANWRAIQSNALVRRSQNLTMRNNRLEREFQDRWKRMEDTTTRRGQDFQREIGGYSYPTIKEYDEMGQVIGERVQPFRMGQPVNGFEQENPKQIASKWSTIKPDNQFYQTLFAMPEEQRNKTFMEWEMAGLKDLTKGAIDYRNRMIEGSRPKERILDAGQQTNTTSEPIVRRNINPSATIGENAFMRGYTPTSTMGFDTGLKRISQQQPNTVMGFELSRSSNGRNFDTPVAAPVIERKPRTFNPYEGNSWTDIALRAGYK